MFTDGKFAVGIDVNAGDHDELAAGFVAQHRDVFHAETTRQLCDRNRVDVSRVSTSGDQCGHPPQRGLLLGKRADRGVAVLELTPRLLAGVLQRHGYLLAVACGGQQRLQ